MDGDRSAASPLVVFTSRPNSHPFQERHIYCQDPVKIGRSVARAHPAPTNAIFDCKVLSRNHALLWFEDNKFYLQDTKSSNGTFVNNQRLSKGSEESDPHEIFSGDIIQFGVDVMENSKREGRSSRKVCLQQVTHGCIMASITLYLPNGTESKPRFSSGVATGCHSISAVHSQEMYQLSQYLQEALHREQVLQEKLSHLQNLLHTTNDSCESSWHALINEDRLLSKLEVLQNQLSAFSKTQTEGSLQQQIISMEEERRDYENNSKDSLRKVLEEKITAIQELSDVERSLANAQNECKHLEHVHEESEKQFTDLTEKYEQKVLEHADLTNKLLEAEQRREEDLEQFEQSRSSLQAQLEEALADKDTLKAKLNHLQSLQIEHISTTAEELKSRGNSSDDSDVRLNGDHTEDSDEDDESTPDTQRETLESLTTQLSDAHLRVEDLQNQLNEADATLRVRDEEIHALNQSVEQAQLEIVAYVTKVATLEEKLKTITENGVGAMEQTTDHLHEKIKHITASHEEVVRKLKDELDSVQAAGDDSPGHLVQQVHDLQEKLSTAQKDTDEMKAHIQSIQAELANEKEQNKQREVEARQLKEELEQTKKEVDTQTSATAEFKEKARLLEDRLQEMSLKHQQQVQQSEEETTSLTQQALENKSECEALREECTSLRTRIQTIEEELQGLQQDNNQLNGEVTSTSNQNEALASEISELKRSYEELEQLKDTLQVNESAIKNNLTDVHKEADMLKDKLAVEKEERAQLTTRYDKSVEELETTRQQVETTQALHSQAQQRLEEVNKQLVVMQEDYRQLCEKSKAGALCSTVPLMVLVLAVAFALYPFLSRLGTAS